MRVSHVKSASQHREKEREAKEEEGEEPLCAELLLMALSDEPEAVGIVGLGEARHGLLAAAASVLDVVRVKTITRILCAQLDDAAACHLAQIVFVLVFVVVFPRVGGREAHQKCQDDHKNGQDRRPLAVHRQQRHQEKE